ncbi:TPA: HNH endonuclease [Acinetobacter baumannii]|nr:HNH endonuclease [Acinetobacter baumannii]HEB4107200.1 HNH endonuclease [Acinetobacter baumannii]HEG4461639.1 HNH endonuclease [Acinetobacter baumannii]
MKRNSLKDIGIDLHDLFEYEDGALIWKEPPDSFFDDPRSKKRFVSRYAGKQAGRKTGDYREVGIKGKRYAEHRIIYFMFTGEEPDYVDHRDGDTNNNRFNNLRAATNSTNQANAKMRHDNASGVKGVSWHKAKGKWRATITHNGKSKHLGLFDSLDEAKRVRQQAAYEVFGDYIDHDR